MKKGIFVVETFNGVHEYLTVIGKRKPNMVFNGKKLHSEEKGYGFTMTNNYAESVEIMATGYKEGLDGLKKCKGTKVHHTGNVRKAIPQAGVVGYAPHVPNAIAGVPQSMISSQKIEQHAKVITIVYDAGASASVDAKSFVKAGRNILDVVTLLELQGYRVRVDIQNTFCTCGECAMCRITVKNHRQPINPLKISYLLLHPSFFRRQGFKWLETVPELTNRDFLGGYGKPLRHHVGSDASTDKIRYYLKEHGLLDGETFFSNFCEAENHSAEELVELLGIKKKK
jgi:hypothetical protein